MHHGVAVIEGGPGVPKPGDGLNETGLVAASASQAASGRGSFPNARAVDRPAPADTSAAINQKDTRWACRRPTAIAHPSISLTTSERRRRADRVALRLWGCFIGPTFGQPCAVTGEDGAAPLRRCFGLISSAGAGDTGAPPVTPLPVAEGSTVENDVLRAVGGGEAVACAADRDGDVVVELVARGDGDGGDGGAVQCAPERGLQ